MRNILVIDDFPEIATTIQSCSPEHQVILALDGIDGLDKLRLNQDNIDLVVLDVKMPRLDGQTTLLLIRNEFPNIPVLVFSAYPNPAVRRLALELTGRPAIFKPMDLDKLAEEIRLSIQYGVKVNVQLTGVLEYAQTLAADLEHRRRLEPPSFRVLVYGNKVVSSGLKSLIDTSKVSITYLHVPENRIHLLNQEHGPIAIAATFDDLDCVLNFSMPVLCIAFDLKQAFKAMERLGETRRSSGEKLMVSIVVVNGYGGNDGLERGVADHIRNALQAVRFGKSYLPEQLENPFFDLKNERNLSKDERDVIKYEVLQLDTKTIAQRLGSTPEAVRQIRSRLVKKLGIASSEWETWADAWWRSHYP